MRGLIFIAFFTASLSKAASITQDEAAIGLQAMIDKATERYANVDWQQNPEWVKMMESRKQLQADHAARASHSSPKQEQDPKPGAKRRYLTDLQDNVNQQPAGYAKPAEPSKIEL